MSASSPMDDIIWACLRHCVTGESVSVDDGGISSQILERAKTHNLLPILAATLPEQPPEIRQQLTTASRQRRIRALVMTQEMLRVVAECAKVGIQVVPLKGVALANTVYISPTLRYFDDLDLLVAPENADGARAIMRKLGYQPHERGSADWHHDTPYTHPKHGTTIDLHTDVVRRYGDDGWSLSDIWARLEPNTIHGQSVEIFSALDALIHTALHARHHLFEKPTFLLDTAMLLRQSFDMGAFHVSQREEFASSDAIPATSEDADSSHAIEMHSFYTKDVSGFANPETRAEWQLLIEEMSAAGALVPFAHLVNILVERQLIEPPPPIPVSRWRLKIARRVHGWRNFEPRAEKLRAGVLPKLIELLLMDSLRDSAAMLQTLLMPDEAFVGEKYGSRLARLVARLRLFGRQLFNR